MAVNTSRSMERALGDGMRDGAVQSVSADRDGPIDPATAEARQDLHPAWYGGGVGSIAPPTLRRPDGTRG